VGDSSSGDGVAQEKIVDGSGRSSQGRDGKAGMQGTQMRTGEVQTDQSSPEGGGGRVGYIKSQEPVAEAAAIKELAALGGRAKTGEQRGRK
jgi:hypothetical protein